MKNKKLLICSVISALSLPTLYANEVISTPTEQNGLNITVYNSHVALITDKRELTVGEGLQTVAFKGVSAQIQPETATLKADGLTLLEQNFEYDLLSPQSLLAKYVGKEVTVIITNPVNGEVTQETATVLANNNGVMLKMGDKIRALDNTMSVIYDKVPNNLRDKPTLTMTLNSQTADKQPVELTYLSGGLHWKADYVANLIDDKLLNLSGWVTLHNSSGTTYHNANLQLVAGEVNRVAPERLGVSLSKPMAKMASVDEAAPMQQESLFEYHLYTLGHKTTLKNSQQKQVALLSAQNVPYQKRLVMRNPNLYGWNPWHPESEHQNLDSEVQISIDNKKANQLGMPIPAGIVRTYQKDSQGNSQFIGEDRIKHTPENESFTLKLGKAFDVTGKLKQTHYNRERHVQKTAVSKIRKHITTMSYEVILKNAKDSDVVVDYLESFFGDWEIVEQSLNSEKRSSTLNHWRVSIPAKGETTLKYTVKIIN